MTVNLQFRLQIPDVGNAHSASCHDTRKQLSVLK